MHLPARPRPRPSRPRPASLHLALLLLLCAATALAGCRPGVGAYLPPTQQVRVIETLNLPPATEEEQLLHSGPPEQPGAQRPITLVDVRELALVNNLDLRVSRLDPQIAAANLDAERAIFDTIFTTGASYTRTDQPTATQLVGSSVEDIRVTPGLIQPLPTGGQIRAEVPMSRFETNNEFAVLNPAYETDLRLTLDHPLARGFGRDVTEQRIRIAALQLGQAQVRQKLDVINLLAIADRTYWLLYAAARSVQVQQQQYDLSVQQLQRTQRLVDQGDQPAVEVLRAESITADTLERLLRARSLERERQRQLKRLLNDPGLQLDGPTQLVPATLPEPLFYALDVQALEQAALTRRMELLEAELRIAEQDVALLAARNAKLPRLDLQYQWNANGLGGSFGDALDQAASLDFQDHSVGLRFEMPIGNREPRARLRSAILRRLQQLATREARILEVRQEVFDAADRLQTGWQQIQAARRRVDLATRLHEAELRRFELGLATGLEVFEAQANLAAAQFAEIEAITAYEIARIDLAVATGTVIGQSNVVLDVPEVRPR